MMPETVKPPAMAYAAVESIIGPSYLTKPPPSNGRRVIVIGHDNIPTQWDMEPETFDRIQPILEGDPRVKRYSATFYDERRP